MRLVDMLGLYRQRHTLDRHGLPMSSEYSAADVLLCKRSDRSLNRYSLFMAGLAHISVPNCSGPPSECETWVSGGKYGMIIANDLKSDSKDGHITEFPSSDTTVIAQFPCDGNVPPAHIVLHKGPCRPDEMLAL